MNLRLYNPFSRKIFIFALLSDSTPVDPQTQNPSYLTPVDPQTRNSSYSTLGEREHKTRARVKISVSWKHLSRKTDPSKTINWPQGRRYPKGNALTLDGKMFPGQLNSQTCMRAVNRQPKFTAPGTRRAFSHPRAHGKALNSWKQTSTASKLESFFVKSQFFFVKSRFVHKMTAFAWKILLFHDTNQVETENQKSPEQNQKDTEMIPEVRWSFNVCSWKSQKSSPIRWHPPSEDRLQKIFRTTSKGYRNDPEVCWRFYVFSSKSENLIKQNWPRWEKHESKRTPKTQNPAYSTPVDPQTPNSLYSALAEREHNTRGRVKISGSWKIFAAREISLKRSLKTISQK